MTAMFRKPREAECQKVGEEEGKEKYVCKVEDGKTFEVLVDETGNFQVRSKYIVPTVDDYKKIRKALIEKGKVVV